MGSEIVYCTTCGERLLERDFQKGKAVTVLKKNYCSVCMVEVAKPKEEPRRRMKTTRVPKAEEAPLSRRPLYIGIAIAVLAFILVMIVLSKGL